MFVLPAVSAGSLALVAAAVIVARTWSPPPEPRSTVSVSLSPQLRSQRASGTWLQ